MKHTSKHNAGFTLIELVVAMAIAVIVTAAATSVLLLGLHANRQTGDTASQQITVRSLLNVMEDVAADGNIKEVVSDIPAQNGEAKEYGSWALIDTTDNLIFHYDAEIQTIFTNGTPVLESVIASNVIMEGQLLSISIETKDGIYSSAIYCRTVEPVGAPDIDTLPGDTTNTEENVRAKFIEILKSQYRSRGEIKNGDGEYTYYSEWYIGGYGQKNPGWNEKTPWCACYIAWALHKVGLTGPSSNHSGWYANVDEFLEYFTPKNATADATQTWLPGGGTPEAGDIIFFDWNKGDNPQHVGVVLKTEGNMVYTIEGNSAGRVTVRSYSLGDPRIIGYGVLPWAGEQTNPQS